MRRPERARNEGSCTGWQDKKDKKDKKDKEKKKDKKEPAADAEVAMPAMSRDEMGMLKEILKQKSCIFQVPPPYIW